MSIQLLLAESDPKLRRALGSYLHAVGFEVDMAADGIECLDRLRSGRPQALIVDVDLPWGGGDGVVARLADGEAPTPRAVVALGDLPPEALSRRVGIPPGACLQKPVHASSLVLRIATLLYGVAPVVERMHSN